MKRVISLIMVLTMLVSVIPVSVSAEDLHEGEVMKEVTQEAVQQEDVPAEEQTPPTILTWEEYRYTLLADGSVSICGFESTPENEEPFLVEIPSEINGSKVTEIAEIAFAGNAEIEAVLLPETIEAIGSGAFEDCNKLKEIAFCGEAPSFGESLVKGSKKLEEIYILEKWDFSAFKELLKKDLGENAAANITCQSYETLASLEEAFATQYKLEPEEFGSIEDDTVTQTGQGYTTYTAGENDGAEGDAIVASGTCGDDLVWRLDRNGVLNISGTGEIQEGYPWDDKKDYIKSAIIEEGVTSIGASVFSGCSNLSTVEIPESVTYIGDNAFYQCKNLTSVIIPDGVTYIGHGAFFMCSSLASITIPGSAHLQDGYYTGLGIFQQCYQLQEVILLEGITSIPSNMFAHCSSLCEVKLPNSLTHIRGEAFGNCTSLKELKLPDSIIDLQAWSFDGCSELYKVNFPLSWTSVTNYRDSYTSERIGGVFRNCTKLEEIHVPDGVTVIPKHAFSDSNIIKITLPNSLKKIDEYAFINCTRLREISIPGSVEEIGDYALSRCSSLTSVTFQEGIQTIGCCLTGCSKLTYVVLPQSVTRISYSTFNDCSSLSDIYYAGSKAEWSNIYNGPITDDSSGITIHYNSTGPILSGTIRYFSIWDEENQIAYFDTDPDDDPLNFGSQVTEETDTSFLENVDNLVGTYVLVETKSRDNGMIGPDYLISIKPVDTNVGIVTAISSTENTITIDATTYAYKVDWLETAPEVGDVVMYHLYEGEIADDVTILELNTAGIVTNWDAETRQITIDSEQYKLSDYADAETMKLLDEKDWVELKVSYIAYEGIVYKLRGGVTVAGGKCGDDLTWTLDNDGTLTISGIGDMYDYTYPDETEANTAPWYEWHDAIKKLVIEDGVTSIGDHAMMYLSMNTISLPASVAKIGDHSFAECDNTIEMIYYGGSVEQWRDLKATMDNNSKTSIEQGVILYNGRTLDVWKIPNGKDAFGEKAEGYYITQSDFDRLTRNLSDTDKEAVTYASKDRSLIAIGPRHYNIDGKGYSNPLVKCETWGGSCYGLSSWVCLVNSGVLNASDIDANVTSLLDYSINKTENSKVESAINFYQHQQQLIQTKNAEEIFSNGRPQQKLTELGQTANGGGTPFLINYQWYKVNNGVCDLDDLHIHCVVGYGWENIDQKEITIHGVTRTYNYRILVYDCGNIWQKDFSDTEDVDDSDRNFYYNDSGEWCIPGQNLVGVFGHTDNTVEHHAQLTLATNDVSIINGVDYRNGTYSGAVQAVSESTDVSSNAMLMTSSDANYTLAWDGGSADISGFSVQSETDEKINVVLDVGETVDGGSHETTATVFLLDGVDSYTVKSDEAMSFVFRNEHYYTGAAMSSSGAMTFSQDGMVSIVADEAAEFYSDIVANDGYYHLPWYKVEISGSSATEIATEKTDEGILVHCDNMDSITIAVTDENGTTEITTGSEEDTILIAQVDGELSVFEDSDGDGKFETDITVGHSYGEWYTVTEATCTTDGEQRRDCTDCDHYQTRVIAAYGHSNESLVTDPTCTEQGYTTHTCSRCGDSYEDSYVDALGHSYQDGICTNCGEADPDHEDPTEPSKPESVPTTPVKPGWASWLEKIFGGWWGEDDEKCDHEYTSVITEPTCDQQGYTTHTCQLCGDSYKDSYTDALGHDWDNGELTKEATCTENGEKTFTCRTCGETKVEKINALGHKFEDGICTECGEENTAEPEGPSKPGWESIWDWISSWWK